MFGFSESKIKPYLKMAVQRMNIANNKKSIQVINQKKEVSALLKERKDEKARIKVEHIIRDDFTIEAYEILQLMCDLVHERMRQIKSQKECPDELKETVCSLIWATNYVDVAELKEIKSQLIKKYGSEFGKIAVANENNVVNVRLYHKLSYHTPNKGLVRAYLEEIAKAYGVEWSGDSLDLPMGHSVPMAPGSGLQQVYSGGGERGGEDGAPGGGSDCGGDTTITTALGAAPMAPQGHVGAGKKDGSTAVVGDGAGAGAGEPTAEELEEYKQFLKNQRKEPSIIVPGTDHEDGGSNGTVAPLAARFDTIPGTNIPVFAAVPRPPPPSAQTGTGAAGAAAGGTPTSSASASPVYHHHTTTAAAAAAVAGSSHMDSGSAVYQQPELVTATPINDDEDYFSSGQPPIHPPAPAAAPAENPSGSEGYAPVPTETAPPAPPTDAFAELQARMAALKNR